MALSEQNSFLAYGFYHLGIAVCYGLASFLHCLQSTPSTLPVTTSQNKSIEDPNRNQGMSEGGDAEESRILAPGIDADH